MFPEVLIAVTKNHWHCITCKVYNKRVVSIDQHLRVKHPDVNCSETSEHPFAQFENVEPHIVHGYKKHSHFNDKHVKLECKITTKCKKETCNTFNTERKSETPPEQHNTIATDASNDKQLKEFSCAIGQRTLRKRKLIKDEWINKKRMIDNGINKNLLQNRLRTRKHKISHIQPCHASFENRLKQVNSLTSVSGKNNKLSFVYQLEEKLLKQSNSGELSLSNSLQENSTFSSDEPIPHSLNKNNTKQQNKMLRIHRIKQKADRLDSKIMTTSKKLTNNKSDSVFQNPDHGALQCSNSKAVKRRELTQRQMRSIKVSYVGTQEQRTVNSQSLASSIPQAHELWEDRQGDTGESDSGMNSVSCDAFSRQQSFIAETNHSISFPSFTRIDLDSKDTFFNQTISIVVNQNLEHDPPIAPNAGLQNSNLDTSSSCVKQLPSAQTLVKIDHKGAKLDHGNEITNCDRQHHNATSAVLRTNDFPVNADSNNALVLESDRHSNPSQKQVTPLRRDSCSISDKEATTASTDEKSWVKTVNFCFNNVVNKQSAIALSENVPSEIYKCRVCFAKFTTSECLSGHETAMAKFFVVHCKKCGQNFHGMHELNLHIFGEHEPYKRGFCFECEMASPSMERLELHVYSHIYSVDRKLTEMRYHDCRICMKEIKGEFVAMKNHYYTKHKAALCFECFTNSELVYFVDVSACREHRQSHAKHCIICKQEFSTAEEAQAHYLTHRGQVEEDGRGISCEKCGHWCPNQAMIVLHRREHKLQLMRDRSAKQARTGFACLQCDKVLRSKRNLERHVTQVHSNIRTYKFHCEFCGKGVDYKSVLQDHIALHHLGIKRYACEFCNQRFACAPTLRRHILKEHATDKQYQCEFCDERFCEKVKLDRHVTSHTGLSRFMCEQCGKGFHTRSEFRNHMKVHALRKEFICSECGQEFKRKEHLTRHMHKSCQNLTQT